MGTKSYAADGISVSFDSARCLHAAECARGLPAVFHPKERPWITPAEAAVDEVIAVVQRCPSGALQYVAGAPESYDVTQVTAMPGEPIWIRGPVTLQTPDGPRTEIRMALCSCGSTANAPHCDASGDCTAWRRRRD
jgi:uncharacterized Fe-S cluster protein YjdI